MVVAAHNEEKVVGQLVDNLKMLRYPNDMYDIFVVADNCSDHTAEVAAREGALVYERHNTNEMQQGKGFALEWMFQKLFALPKQYDAVVIFDADNLVHLDFLMEINNRYCKGERLIQATWTPRTPTIPGSAACSPFPSGSSTTFGTWPNTISACLRLWRYGHVHFHRYFEEIRLAGYLPYRRYGIYHEVPAGRDSHHLVP